MSWIWAYWNQKTGNTAPSQEQHDFQKLLEPLKQTLRVSDPLSIPMANIVDSLSPKYTEEKVFQPKKVIKHFVLSGGSAGILCIYGALKKSNQMNLWNWKDLKTLWGTSAGSLLCVITALNLDWNDLDDYFIQRPWQTLIKLNWLMLLNEKGLMDQTLIDGFLAPLLHAKDMSLDITMKEFYEKTGKDIHLFTTRINIVEYNFETVDVNAKTYPDWKLRNALYASCCLPLIFKPYEVVTETQSEIFLDGGILSNFPFHYCIQHEDVLEEEVFGIYLNKWENPDGKQSPRLKDLSLFHFVKIFSSSVFNYTDKTGRKQPKNSSSFLAKLVMDLGERFDLSITQSSEKREEMIRRGERLFLEQLSESFQKWTMGKSEFSIGKENDEGGGHEIILEERDVDAGGLNDTVPLIPSDLEEWVDSNLEDIVQNFENNFDCKAVPFFGS